MSAQASIGLSSALLAEAFPFHFALDRSLRFVRTGAVLERLAGGAKGQLLSDKLHVVAPRVELGFEEIMKQQRSLFMFKLSASGLVLKGQMAYEAWSDELVFLGSPWITDVGRLAEMGLTLSDFAAHDPLTDLLFLIQAKNTALADARRLAEKVAQTSRLKDEFLANMSHELRTPLNSILGLSEALLEEAYGPLNDQQGTFLRTIEESGRHLLSLIGEILDLSKVEAGTLVLERDPVSPVDVCSASLRLVRQAAAKKKQKLSHLMEEGIPEVLADERRLKQVLVNLLSNAVKFTPEGGSLGLEVTLDEARGAVSFSVWDTGIGISPEGIELLFKPFVQLDGGLARKHEGAGLGLALAYRLTELQNGSIAVESAVGKGSRFTVRLPIVAGSLLSTQLDESADESAPSEPEASCQSGPGSRRLTLLLAEDNELNIQTLQPYLEHQGYLVEVARDGFEAVASAQRKAPDLVLMDVQMPRMDGLEATRRLRADERLARVPIIALTALAMPGDRQRCIEAGADEYVSKPFRLRRLISLIKRKIQQRSRSAQPKEAAE